MKGMNAEEEGGDFRPAGTRFCWQTNDSLAWRQTNDNYYMAGDADYYVPMDVKNRWKNLWKPTYGGLYPSLKHTGVDQMTTYMAGLNLTRL